MSSFAKPISVAMDILAEHKLMPVLVARVDIPANTLLFTIPRPGVINITTSDLSKKLPQLFETDSPDADEDGIEEAGSDPWLSLILVLIYEHLQGEQSQWKPYFDVLPAEFDTPMFWPEEDISELQASSLRSKIGKESADSMLTKKILPTVTAHEDVFYPAGSARLGEQELLNLAHRMGSLIMAYAFDLAKDDENEEAEDDVEDGWVEDKDSTMLGMVPMADILNSDAEFNVRTRTFQQAAGIMVLTVIQAHVDHADDFLTVTSLRDIRQGEEVLNYYGPLANSDLLRRYGYTSPKHSRYDVVEISQPLVGNQVQQAMGLSDAFKDKAVSSPPCLYIIRNLLTSCAAALLPRG
ncbi:SET domain-containing protein-lysine N-methyltransferase [Candidatus Bathyarchaeota archaeon]|nr:SET domain-containing protein-lysine N-methyltransferase [Candidatus Bathyarchaeota archaeon]